MSKYDFYNCIFYAGIIMLLSTLIASGVVVGMNDTPFSYESMFDNYNFANGQPFGVKVGE